MSAIRNLIAEANSAMAVLQDFQIKDDQLNQQIVELQQRLSGLLQDRAELVPLLEEARGKEMKAQEDLRAFYQQVPPLPASPPASPKEQVPGAPKKKGGRKPYSPEQKVAAAASEQAARAEARHGRRSVRAASAAVKRKSICFAAAADDSSRAPGRMAARAAGSQVLKTPARGWSRAVATMWPRPGFQRRRTYSTSASSGMGAGKSQILKGQIPTNENPRVIHCFRRAGLGRRLTFCSNGP
jgi:hypothetical protein